MTGTLLNVATVIVGGLIGTFLGARLPEKVRQTVMNGLGLVTVVLGVSMALETGNVLIVMASVLVGGILGEWWRIEDGLEAIGNRLEKRFGGPQDARNGQSIMRAFVTSSLVFCVGPLTVVGAALDGLTGNFQPLAVKSLLDGFAALAFGASLGPGVLFSAVTILLYQGGLSLAAMGLGSTLGTVTAETPAVIEMGATGGVLILGIGFLLLDLKKVRVGNFLPAIVVAPLLVRVLQYLGVSF